MSAYIYIRSGNGLYTVGFRDSAGKWRPESDHFSQDRAAAYVEWLNSDRALSAAAPEMYEALREICSEYNLSDHEDMHALASDMAKIARAALAAAKGEWT